MAWKSGNKMAIHSSSIRLARANLLPFASLTHGTQGTHLAHFFLLIYKTAGKRKKRLGKEEKMVSQSGVVWCGEAGTKPVWQSGRNFSCSGGTSTHRAVPGPPTPLFRFWFLSSFLFFSLQPDLLRWIHSPSKSIVEDCFSQLLIVSVILSNWSNWSNWRRGDTMSDGV